SPARCGKTWLRLAEDFEHSCGTGVYDVVVGGGASRRMAFGTNQKSLLVVEVRSVGSEAIGYNTPHVC
ncbi:MAG TPA: hypothetical protein VLM19_06235, partial [Nitrospiraceae bacterium]|nr:hypothetical protein [Nitrospiraceae bacterium]